MMEVKDERKQSREDPDDIIKKMTYLDPQPSLSPATQAKLT
jgi:hypothetical protein